MRCTREHESAVFARYRGALCHRPGVACEAENLFGELRILAAEVMSGANLLPRDMRLLQARTYAVLLAFAVYTQHRLVAEIDQLRPGRQPGGVRADPVSNADLE